MSTIAAPAVGTGRTGPVFPRLRRAAVAALVANIGIVLTGGIVRVSESGLGCPDWPACEGTRVVPAATDAQWHTVVEFGNRLLTFVVLAAALWVVLAARREATDRPDLRRLAWIQPVGVGAQAALGGVTVLTGLHPLVVAAHFLASMALVAAAVVLVVRADGRPHDVAPGLRIATAGLVVVAGAVLVLGTLVTGAGPHAGDPGTVRLGLDIRTIAVAHADAVWLLVGLTVAILAVAVATGSSGVRRAAGTLLALELFQGGLGYLQYALGVPPLPVVFHILGAALVWAAAWWVAMQVRPAAPARSAAAPAPSPAESSPSPAGSSPSPAESSPSPAESSPSPAESSPRPAEGAPSPAEGAPSPAEGAPSPAEDPPSPAEPARRAAAPARRSDGPAAQ